MKKATKKTTKPTASPKKEMVVTPVFTGALDTLKKSDLVVRLLERFLKKDKKQKNGKR